MTETTLVPDDPSEMDLPFWGKVKVGKHRGRVIWGPECFWFVGGKIADAKYWAWVNGATFEVPDPLQCPWWPWHPAAPDEWLSLYREWENADAGQR